MRTNIGHCAIAVSLAWSLQASNVSAQLVSTAYEEAPEFWSTQLLPANVRQSGHYRVEDQIDLKGNNFVFDIDSNYGLYRVETLPMLWVRTHELRTLAQAIGQYQERDDRFAEELRGQLTYNAESLVDVVVAPFNMAGQFVENVGQTAQEFSELGTGGSAQPNGASYVDPVITDVVTSAHKRNIAFQLDLDPYSTNPKVQEFLNTVARARSGGHFVAGTATIRVPPSRVVQVDNGRLDSQIKAAIKNLTPAELDDAINEQLRAFGVGNDTRASFVFHPHYSPRHKTAMIAHLDYMRGVQNRAALVSSSLVAASEADAMSFEMLTRMLAYYHESVAPLVSMNALGGVPVAASDRGVAVVAMPVDYIIWNRGSDWRFSGLSEQLSAQGFKQLDLLLTGRVSERARTGLESYGFTIHEGFVLAEPRS